MTARKVGLAAAFITAGMAAATAQAAEHGRLSGELSGALQYDSNVALGDIDTVSFLGDTIARLDARIDYTRNLTARTGVDFSYDLSKTSHQDFKAFDLQTHLASAQLSHDFGKTEASATYRLIVVRLAGNAFLTEHQLSPALKFTLSKSSLIRTAYTYTDKHFDGRPLRDAHNQALSVDGYYFFKGGIFSAGYRHAREDAAEQRFSYDSDLFKVKLVRRFNWSGRKVEAQLSANYEDRPYVGITPAIAAVRHDRRGMAQASLEVPLKKALYVRAEYAYSDYRSNLPVADYRQQVVTLRIGKRF